MRLRPAGAARPFAAGTLAAFLGALLLAGGCAATPKRASAPRGDDVIVLLPDEHGKTGAIIVSGEGGQRLLSEPRQAVRVSAGAPPGKPFVMTGEEVSARAGPALRALPPPPVRFVLFFRHDTAELTAESRPTMAAVVRAIRERGAVDISVVGHTDRAGRRDHNYRLSLERSRAVAARLTAEGADASILQITSHGEDNPLVPTRDRVHEPRNRRVEVTVR